MNVFCIGVSVDSRPIGSCGVNSAKCEGAFAGSRGAQFHGSSDQRNNKERRRIGPETILLQAVYQNGIQTVVYFMPGMRYWDPSHFGGK